MTPDEYRRGEIYLCDFGDPVGHEPGYRRAAMILSATAVNRHGLCVVIPITSKHHGYPTHVQLDDALPVLSFLQCELLGTVSTDRLTRRVGRIGSPQMAQVEKIVRRLLVL